MPGRNALTVEVLNFLALVTQKAILFIFTPYSTSNIKERRVKDRRE